MTLLERIQTIVNEKGLSIKRLEKECGLANATIRRWDNQSPRLENVNVVANYLQVSLDYLVGNSSPISTDNSITNEQLELLKMYESLDSRDKSEVRAIIKMKSERSQGNTASYSTLTSGDGNDNSGSSIA